MATRKAFSKQTHAEVFAKSGGRCTYCGGHLTGKWQIDHFSPLAAGGTNAIRNLVPACNGCNRSKNADTIEDFRLRIRLKLAKWPIYFSVPQIRFLMDELKIKLPLPPAPKFYYEWVDKEPA